jgi:hypothetical protein
MINKNDLYIIQSRGFDIIIWISWILYISIALGLSLNAPQYLDDLQYYVKMYVSLFLIYRFIPFRRVKFTELDAKIAFSAGIFLFTTTAINTILQTYLKDIKSYITTIM